MGMDTFVITVTTRATWGYKKVNTKEIFLFSVSFMPTLMWVEESHVIVVNQKEVFSHAKMNHSIKYYETASPKR